MSMGGAVTDLVGFLLLISLLAIPLALWKVVDIGIWIYSHVGVSFQ